MKQSVFFGVVLCVAVAFMSGLLAPRDSFGEKKCEPFKLVADLNIDRLEGEDAALETLRQAYRRLANGVNVPMELVLADNVTWTVEGVSEGVPFAGTYAGKEGVLRYMEDVREAVCIEALYARYFLKEGSAVNVHLYEEGVVESTGKRFAMEVVHVWRLNEDGKIDSFREYNDTFAMLAAFDPEADPALSLVANDADYDIPTSSFTDTLATGLALYAALGAEDIFFIIAHSDPELVWILAGPEHITPMAGTFYGPQGLGEFFFRLSTTQEYVYFNLREIVVDGSRMDAEFEEAVYVKDTGEVYTCDGLHTIMFSDEGYMRSFRSYNDTYSVAMGHLPGE